MASLSSSQEKENTRVQAIKVIFVRDCFTAEGWMNWTTQFWGKKFVFFNFLKTGGFFMILSVDNAIKGQIYWSLTVKGLSSIMKKRQSFRRKIVEFIFSLKSDVFIV